MIYSIGWLIILKSSKWIDGAGLFDAVQQRKNHPGCSPLQIRRGLGEKLALLSHRGPLGHELKDKKSGQRKRNTDFAWLSLHLGSLSLRPVDKIENNWLEVFPWAIWKVVEFLQSDRFLHAKAILQRLRGGERLCDIETWWFSQHIEFLKVQCIRKSTWPKRLNSDQWVSCREIWARLSGAPVGPQKGC